jgi:hypothetical protein
VASWRSTVRAAFCAPHGRDALGRFERIRAPGTPAVAYPLVDCAWSIPRVPTIEPAVPLGIGKLPDPPSSATTHAVANWLDHVTGTVQWEGSGSRFTPLYRVAPASPATTLARLHLRTSSHSFTGVATDCEPALLWGASTCPLCAAAVPTGADAGVPAAQPILDAWHRVTECPALDGERVAALRQAAARAAAEPQLAVHAAAFGEIEAHRHSAAGRAFVFLATLGATVPAGMPSPSGLPASWTKCLVAPRSRDRRAVCSEACVSTAVTLPAFAGLARRVAQPCAPSPVTVPPAGSLVG